MFGRNLGLMLALFWVGLLPGQVEDKRPDREAVAVLIRKLDAEEFATREEALVQLKALGPGAREHILALMPEASIEARLRLEGLLEELSGTSRELEGELRERLLGLDLRQATVADALDLIARKTGFQFGDTPHLDQKRLIDFEIKEATAFQLLDEFAAEVGQRWVQDYGSGEIRFYLAAPGSAPQISYQGPFRFSLESVAVNSTLVFGTETRSNCYLQGRIDMEPGDQVMGLFIQPQLVEAIDDQGLDLTPENEQGSNFQIAGMRRNFHFNLRFTTPSAGAKSLTKVVAELEVVVPRRFDELVLGLNGDEQVSVESPDTALRFRSVTKAGPQLRFELEIERDLPMTEGTRPVEVPFEAIEVTTTDGQRLRPIGPIQRQKQQKGEILRFNIEDRGQPLQSIALKSLVEIGTKKLRVNFGDVPLP